jgi:hypothetical protein
VRRFSGLNRILDEVRTILAALLSSTSSQALLLRLVEAHRAAHNTGRYNTQK